jgi:hypothetical protein
LEQLTSISQITSPSTPLRKPDNLDGHVRTPLYRERNIMAKSTDANDDEPAPGEKNDQQRLNAKAAARSPGRGAKDRPGFDLGGAVTDATGLDRE